MAACTHGVVRACSDTSHISLEADITGWAGVIGSRCPEVRTAGTPGRLLEGPQFFDVVDGSVTQIKWINHNSLAIGTAFGYLHLWSMAEARRFDFEMKCVQF